MAMVRLLKPGDRVRVSDDGTTMEVIKYITKNDWFLGDYISDYEVECAWYDPEEGRKTRVYDQRQLIKIEPEKNIETHSPVSEDKEEVTNPNLLKEDVEK